MRGHRAGGGNRSAPQLRLARAIHLEGPDQRSIAPRDVLGRLLRFHAGNGAVSILGNVALMRVLVGMLHLNAYLASGISIALCSLLNFAASEWFVFRK